MARLNINDIISYRDMCNAEQQEQLQRGMNFNIGDGYSVVLMSVRSNAPYNDKISEDGLTIYYEGHDEPGDRIKKSDQPHKTLKGSLTQNGLFVEAIRRGIIEKKYPLVRVYEKIQPGIWTYRGLFEMINFRYIQKRDRKVFVFEFRITDQDLKSAKQHRKDKSIDIEQSRQIPGKVKFEVYKRDQGRCKKCGAADNLHFDHLLPYSKEALV